MYTTQYSHTPPIFSPFTNSYNVYNQFRTCMYISLLYSCRVDFLSKFSTPIKIYLQKFSLAAYSLYTIFYYNCHKQKIACMFVWQFCFIIVLGISLHCDNKIINNIKIVPTKLLNTKITGNLILNLHNIPVYNHKSQIEFIKIMFNHINIYKKNDIPITCKFEIIIES